MRNKILFIADTKVYGDPIRKRFQENCPDAYIAEVVSTEELLDKVDELAPNIISTFTGKDFKEQGAKHESTDRGWRWP